MTTELSWTVTQRLRLIDIVLDQTGRFNRAILVDYFGISTPQASHDIGAYLKLAGHNAVYDFSAQCYVRTTAFKRVWL